MRADDGTDCHVLVIGSSGAGVRAAIEASAYGDVALTQGLDQGGDCTVVFRRRESCSDCDELIGNPALCRYDNGKFISRFMVFLQDIDNTLDTLGIGNGCPAEFH
jgi:hypothetical protein